MPTLGDMLADARRSTGGLEEWLGADQPELMAELHQAAATAGLSATSYARMAVADFSRLAEEESWADIMSRMRDAADPGRSCLAGMLRWRMSAPGCSAHGRIPSDEGAAHGR